MDERGWFEVQTTVTLRAVSADDAINRVASFMRSGYKNGVGLYPVGTFNARSCDDPRKQARDKLKVGSGVVS